MNGGEFKMFEINTGDIKTGDIKLFDLKTGDINIDFQNNVKIGDFLGLGEAVHSVPDTIEAIGNCAIKVTNALDNVVNTVGNIIKSPFELTKLLMRTMIEI